LLKSHTVEFTSKSLMHPPITEHVFGSSNFCQSGWALYSSRYSLFMALLVEPQQWEYGTIMQSESCSHKTILSSVMFSTCVHPEINKMNAITIKPSNPIMKPLPSIYCYRKTLFSLYHSPILGASSPAITWESLFTSAETGEYGEYEKTGFFIAMDSRTFL